MTKPSEEAGVTLKVSHAELNLNRLTKEESNEGERELHEKLSLAPIRRVKRERSMTN